MDAKAKIRLQFASEKRLRTLIEGLTPETFASSIRRAKVAISREGRFLVLDVTAKDTVALRSTLNAYLRWMDSTLKVLEVVEGS